MATYYVSTSGSDSAAGGVTTPWLTLQHAVSSVEPGDTINVESGTYVGCRIGISGTEASPITLQAAAEASVVVSGAGPSNVHGSTIEIENFSSTVSYWTISGLTAQNASLYAGIDVRSSNNITITNCICTNNYSFGIFSGTANHLTINNCTASNSQTAHGIYLSNSGNYATITGCTVSNNDACGIEFNGGGGTMTGNVVADNFIYGNGAIGGAALNFDGFINSQVYNNLLYNNAAGGIVLYMLDGATGSTGNVVVNNTVVMPSGARFGISIDNGSTGNIIENNIVTSTSGCVEIDSGSTSGFVCNYNVYNTGGQFSTNGGNSDISFASWKTNGYDANSLTGTTTAIFVSPSTNNYQLATGSPALANGSATYAPSVDINGTPRNGVIDIGAYQDSTSQPTLTAAAGSFTMTGKAATLATQRKVTAANGSFALSGSAAALFKAAGLFASNGVFTDTGEAAGLTSQRKMTAVDGVFVMTGEAATLSVHRNLTAANGSFAVTGEAINLNTQRTLSPIHGLYTVTGQSAGLFKGNGFLAIDGTFTMTGEPVTLSVQRKVTAVHGSFVETGEPIVLNSTRTFVLNTGSFSETGFPVILSVGSITIVNGSALIQSGSVFSGTGVFILSCTPKCGALTARPPGSFRCGTNQETCIRITKNAFIPAITVCELLAGFAIAPECY